MAVNPDHTTVAQTQTKDRPISMAVLDQLTLDQSELYDPRVSYDGQGFVYSLARSAGEIFIGYWPGYGPHTYSSIPFTEFGGYDLATEDFLINPAAPAFFVYSKNNTPGNPLNIHLGHYRPNYLDTFPVTAHTQQSNMSSTLPAIAADSVINSGTGKPGALLVWNTEYQPVPGITSHRVESNRYQITQNYPNLAASPEYQPHLILDDGLTAPSYPDIARVINFMPGLDGPRGIAVWEGGGEMSPCSPARPTEIYGQHTLYDASLPSGGPQWAQPAMIGPGPGNYHQRDCLVKGAYPGEAAVYWCDTQNSNTGIMSTMLRDFGATIRWVKQSQAESNPMTAQSLSVDALWPQPLTTGGELHVRCSAHKEEQVELALYDVLGSRIEVLYSGLMHEASMTVSLNTSTLRLAAGTYILRLTSGSAQATRVFVILQ